MSTHTSAPWRRVGPKVETDRGTICIAPNLPEGGVFDKEVNLDLIAAAPELLEALVNTTQTLRLLLVLMDPADADARAEVRNEIRLAEAAIAKARGEE